MAYLNQFIFFDFEMICSNRGMPFADMEAIRLGAVKYNLDTSTISYFDRYIKPTKQQPLTDFCKNLTGIEDHHLTNAQQFNDVFEEFLTWVGGIKKSRFFSWSTSDLSRLKIDANKHHIPEKTIIKIEKRYVDFQAIFKRRVARNNLSVENALQLYDLEFTGAKHNPMYDAYNTLKIYLNFLNQPLKSDFIMLEHFIFDNVPHNVQNLNRKLSHYMRQDMFTFIEQLNDIYRMRDASKVVKRTRKMVEKYENVLINRSGLFSKENVETVRLLVSFYHELLISFDEHYKHSSKIMLLDESIILPLQELTKKRG
ncbi:3'-5' exonuclease [Anaerobacillus sp. MEB173]|uniref:3'-5' exonuclease n=1 Tax=Anaerobacillus sp. MEB173 TaxID=3383345 RepID=UPI003F90EB5C